MNPETAEVVYRDETRVVYEDEGKFYEGKTVEVEGEQKLQVREIDGYRIVFLPGGKTEWAGVEMRGEAHVNFFEMLQ